VSRWACAAPCQTLSVHHSGFLSHGILPSAFCLLLRTLLRCCRLWSSSLCLSLPVVAHRPDVEDSSVQRERRIHLASMARNSKVKHTTRDDDDDVDDNDEEEEEDDDDDDDDDDDGGDDDDDDEL